MIDLHFYEPINMKELELLCRYGFNVNEKIEKHNNQTPLSIFINKHYSIPMLDILIKNGARFDIQDNIGQTSVHLACQAPEHLFEYVIENAPFHCINIKNQSGSTPLDLVYYVAYDEPSLERMRCLHILLNKNGKLTRYGMREPGLVNSKKYKLFDILTCKEFLLKYRLRDVFDITIRPLTWSIFLFYDVLRSCENSTMITTDNTIILAPIQQNQNSQHISHNSQMIQTIQLRLECYFIALIENGEISIEKLIQNQLYQQDYTSLSSSPISELDKKIILDTQNILMNMTYAQTKLKELRHQTLKLKTMCRIKIKDQIKSYPNDILELNISKLLKLYLTYNNPFIKTNSD
ncbi:unnamed protein product [Didymodactylos carnosus]|uniref:Uncharacterized protein n=1 Tax=Didymodactylos carnosus TaxID=1234261 RepID=A0A815YH80_9BILA|nr:unnamed protein product [Didymodactylos carnosus]CAF4433385.1 unnamed protein product [Didymodactylos carnosus]